MSPIVIVLIMICLLLALMAMGMPIAFSMVFIAILGLAIHDGPGVATGLLTYYPFDFARQYNFTVVPMFIVMGQLAFNAGFTKELFGFTRAWLGRLPGGLVLGTIAGCAAFSACSGSSLATAAAMGKISIPEMRRYGYSKQIAAGSVAAGGTLGILIPPSIFLVIYGVMTETSVGKLLIAGIIPGLLSAVMFMLSAVIRSVRNPDLAPAVRDVTWRQRISSIKDVWGVVVIAFIVLGTIYAGICTPTEAAAMGAIGVLLLGFFTRRLNLRTIKEAFVTSIYSSATIMAIALGALLIIPFFTTTDVPATVSHFISDLNVPPLVVVLALCPGYIILGMFIDSVSLMLMSLPVIFPTIVSLGLDPIWFGVIMVKFVELGLITPPVGMNLYVIRGIAPDFSMLDIYRGVIWFVVADICTLALLVLFPQITLFLPNLMT
jgi:tripartite ATP-independent transporter DctM subunit